MIAFDALPELSLYVHLPWCLRKCPYCDFNSHEAQGDLAQTEYVQALLLDLESELPQVWGRPITSVFIGGGTPSLFSPQAIADLLSGIRARVRVLPGAEITMEANPGTFEAERFEGFRQAGINRLSLGIQSFDDRQLRVLGRVHDVAQALQAARSAVKIFDRVNLDLMFGLPGQTLSDLQEELAQALAMESTHLSCYQLTLEPNTMFATRPPEGLPDDDQLAYMQLVVIDTLGAHGFERYEISAFSKTGARCAHNLNYWTFGDYLGIGAGAHGKVSSADRIVRTHKRRHPQAYQEAAVRGEPGAGRDPIEVSSLPFEFMLNALRLIHGVPVARWRQTTGLAVGEHPFLLERLTRAQERGLLARDPGIFRASPRGLDLLNDLQSMFLL